MGMKNGRAPELESNGLGRIAWNPGTREMKDARSRAVNRLGMGNLARAIRSGAGQVRRTLVVLPALGCVLLALGCAGATGASASPSAAGPQSPPTSATAVAVDAPTLVSGFHAVSGINGYSVFKLSPVQRDQQLAAIEAAEVKVVRSDSVWNQIEPLPPGPTGHVYQWAGYDQWVTALATHHLTWEPLIDFTVGWAKTCPGYCAPTSDSTYATFAQAVAARYGANGTFWAQNPQLPYYPAQFFEIWDEPDNSTFYIAPARFATMYSAARTAIHAVDPTASVIVGGLSDDARLPGYNPSHDYPAVYAYQMFGSDPGLKGNVDGFGLHPYAATAADVVEWTVHFRQVLDSIGEASAPIDITEIGWTTGDPSREAWRASMMSAVAGELARSDCGVRLLAPYDWVNPGIDDSTSNPDFGLIDSSALNTSLRPAGTAWFKAFSQAATMPVLRLCHPAPVKPKPKLKKHRKPKPKRPSKHRRSAKRPRPAKHRR